MSFIWEKIFKGIFLCQYLHVLPASTYYKLFNYSVNNGCFITFITNSNLLRMLVQVRDIHLPFIL